jgi:hypothetical protein
MILNTKKKYYLNITSLYWKVIYMFHIDVCYFNKNKILILVVRNIPNGQRSVESSKFVTCCIMGNQWQTQT